MTDMNAKVTPTLAKILQGRLKDLRIRSLNPVFWPPMEMNMEDHWKVFLGKIKQIEENKLTHTIAQISENRMYCFPLLPNVLNYIYIILFLKIVG